MKIEKFNILKNKSKHDLIKLKQDLLKEHFVLRMQKGSSQLKQNHLFKVIKRNIARINTILQQQIYNKNIKKVNN